MWHNEEQRSSDSMIDDLGTDGLRCHTRIGEWTQAHFPQLPVHCLHVVPMTAVFPRDVSTVAFLDEPLLQDPRIAMVALAPLSPRGPGMGSMVKLKISNAADPR